MRTYKLLFLLILLAFFGGCKKQRVFIGKSKYNIEFKHEYAFPASEPLLEVSGQSIHIIDTLLVVEQLYQENPTHHWDVYNLNTFGHLKSSLMHGRGPGEVLLAHYVGQYEKINDEYWLFFMDLRSSEFLKINLTGSIQSGKDIIELVFSPIDSRRAPYFALDEDTFIYCNRNHNEGYVSILKGDNSWKNPVTVKKIYRNITSDDYDKFLHAYSMYYNKKNNKICVNPRYVDHIQIIDLEGNNDMILSTAASDNWPSVRLQKDFMESSIFYDGIRITDDYIFALYLNTTLSELAQDGTPREIEIHIFNWDGDAIAKILLEDHIVSFAVDSENKILYGINNLEQIYRYNIKSFLE